MAPMQNEVECAAQLGIGIVVGQSAAQANVALHVMTRGGKATLNFSGTPYSMVNEAKKDILCTLVVNSLRLSLSVVSSLVDNSRFTMAAARLLPHAPPDGEQHQTPPTNPALCYAKAFRIATRHRHRLQIPIANVFVVNNSSLYQEDGVGEKLFGIHRGAPSPPSSHGLAP